ncbi:NPC1-like intracellular cholesterol transporter 1 [Lampetra planeri]
MTSPANAIAMGYGRALLMLALVQVTVGTIHEAGYCVAKYECGRNPNVPTSLIPSEVPCVDNSEADTLSGVALELLRDVCPMLYKGENNTRACCGNSQLVSLKKSMDLSVPILARCPSCLYNFRLLHCTNICSPDQSLYVNVTRTFETVVAGVNKTGVLEFNCLYTRRLGEEAFESCQSVAIPATGGFAIDAMCGVYGSTLCTAQRWLDFQGDISNGLAPIDIIFDLVPDGETAPQESQGMRQFNDTTFRCTEAVEPDGPACSCQDCVKACPPLTPPPDPPGPWMLGRLDGPLVIGLVVFAGLTLLFTAFAALSHLLGRERSKGGGRGASDDDLPPVVAADVTCLEKLGENMQGHLSATFRRWGVLVAHNPIPVIIASVVVVAVLAVGLVFIELTTDPVELWSSPSSRARQEKDFHDANFGPFFRTNQLILRSKGGKATLYPSMLFGTHNFSSTLQLSLLLELLELQTQLQDIRVDVNGTAVSLKDICFAPLSPEQPKDTDCAVNSLLQYFQNNKTSLLATAEQKGDGGKTGTVDWRDHFMYCIRSPLSFKDVTALELSCMADYGAPVFPFLAVGGYHDERFTESEALILTFSTNNFARDHPKFEFVLAWEAEFIRRVHKYKDDPASNFTVVFMAERSLEDEINRTTAEDLPIFAISYAVIFAYIALALGEYSSWKRVLIDSKVTLGLGGIFVVLASVAAAMGVFAYAGVPSSLVILEVVPFLILAVGADNIFIFVLELQRDELRKGEKREEQIGRVLGEVAPSMLLCSVSESVCFFLGTLTEMPAVRTFALYAGLAVIFNFCLQMSMFVSLVALDSRRRDANRMDICCCVRPSNVKAPKRNEGFLLPFMRRYYSRFLLHRVTRAVVMIVFIFMFSASLFLMFHVQVGLDQRLALPKDSYALDYLNGLYEYLEVGLPTYFVTTGGYNFSSEEGTNAVCGSAGCNNDSMMQKIQMASEYPDHSYLAISASSWVDDFVDWLNPYSSCCRLYSKTHPQAGEFCNSTVETPLACLGKCIPVSQVRPDVQQFEYYLPIFLKDVPTLKCAKGGLGAYGNAVKMNEAGEIIASRFMAYHVPMTTSADYTAGLLRARELADSITRSMRAVPGTHPDFTVFPYTITYVFYEQYETMVRDGAVNLAVCLVPTFVVCCVVLGLDILSGAINLFVIVMIVIDTLGVMTLFSIEFNAISLINLVAAVGISVEFVSHITRAFAVSVRPTKVARAQEAVTTMGSAVLAGVAMTNLPGIIILAFAKAQLVQVFFFQLNLAITLLGAVHGLIFLPVVLSYFGPRINKATLLKLQTQRAQKGDHEFSSRECDAESSKRSEHGKHGQRNAGSDAGSHAASSPGSTRKSEPSSPAGSMRKANGNAVTTPENVYEVVNNSAF